MASYPKPNAKVTRGAPPIPVRLTAGLDTPTNVLPLKPLRPVVAEKPVLHVRESGEGQAPTEPLRYITDNPRLGSIAKPACESPEDSEYEEVSPEFRSPTHSASNTPVSHNEAKSPSVYDISEKDVANFKPGDGTEDESEDINLHRRSPKAKDCGLFVKVVCCISCLLCLWPVNCICLFLACCTSEAVSLGIDLLNVTVYYR